MCLHYIKRILQYPGKVLLGVCVYSPLKQVTKFFTLVSSRKSWKSSTYKHVMLAAISLYYFKDCIYVSWFTHLSVVVDVVKVFSDTRLWALALDVRGGCSGGNVAGGQAAQC